MELPLALRTAIESGGVTLFLGAGVCHYCTTPEGDLPPDAAELARRLARHISVDPGDSPSLPKVSQLVELRKSRSFLEKAITQELEGMEPNDTLVWLFSQTWRAIFTTNYDRAIQRSYELVEMPTQQPVTIGASPDIVWVDPRFQVGIYHLHGSLFEGELRSALITENDYARFRERRAMLFDVLKQSFATSPILYVGYSNQDPNWAMIRSELQAEFSPSVPPNSFRVAPGTDALDIEILSSQGIETLEGDLDDFRRACERELPGLRVEPHRLDDLRSTVPPALLDSFDRAPNPTLRLLTSWEYVNQADFSLPANTNAFLRGDTANWSLVEKGIPFERDIEESLLDSLLDSATDPKRSNSSEIVLAPAGYGVTTVLKRVAVRLALDQVGTVLWLRPNATLLASDIMFAVDGLPSPVFFVVDNASDAGVELSAALTQVREGGAVGHFVLGDRLNEWRQRRLRTRPKEWTIDPLSEPEIDRLLECLEDNSALGVLAGLSRTLQVAAVREKHGKELLVAMREATSGLAFDAIVEDEYRSLASDSARAVYGLVSSLYRTRALARIELVAAVLGVSQYDLYQTINEELEGVVVLESLDDGQDLTTVRPRHHVIGDLVWQRCLDGAERESLLLRIVKELNLNFAADARAFEQLVRSDDSVDEISDVEGRIEFFERACKKDPMSAYVRQHYARMLLRAEDLDGALQQVNEGLSLGNKRVLHHTKGVVLKEMAVRSASSEVGRRRLVQSESEFRNVLTMNRRDEYGYQGLCELFFEWATVAPTPEEQVEYLKKCEATLAEGLPVVRDKEGLRIVEASVAGFLDDDPAAVAVLEKAVSENPDAIVSRYMLAREYQRDGKHEKAIATVEPVLEHHPDQYRCAMLSARSMLQLARNPQDCVAVMSLSSLTGERDGRYLAAMIGYRFMAEHYEEIDRLVGITESGGFSAGDLNHVEMRAQIGPEPIRYSGSVLRVRSGFAFVRASGIPRDVFCPGRELGASGLREGSTVSFEIGFTARGPVAIDVRDSSS